MRLNEPFGIPRSARYGSFLPLERNIAIYLEYMGTQWERKERLKLTQLPLYQFMNLPVCPDNENLEFMLNFYVLYVYMFVSVCPRLKLLYALFSVVWYHVQYWILLNCLFSIPILAIPIQKNKYSRLSLNRTQKSDFVFNLVKK